MFGLETLDVLIGLVTVYLAFGLACTAIVEMIVSAFSFRSANLTAAIDELLAGDIKEGEDFAKAFFAHPIIQALSQGENGRPSYIDKETFSRVVLSILKVDETTASVADTLKRLPDGTGNRIAGMLETFAAQGAQSATELRRALEGQFDATMVRASGWFKRKAQWISFGAALVLVVGANVDTLELIRGLSNNPAARLKLVTLAEEHLQNSKEVPADAAPVDLTQRQEFEKRVTVAQASVAEAKDHLTAGGIPLGWKTLPTTCVERLNKLTGLGVSVFAVMLGAPFWFDVLEKFMRVRGGGAKADEGLG